MDPDVARPAADVKRDEGLYDPARRGRTQAAIALLNIVASAAQPAEDVGAEPRHLPT